MIWVLIGVSGLFFLIGIGQMYYLQRRITDRPPMNEERAFGQFNCAAADGTTGGPVACAQWMAVAALEAHLVELRYHQANVALLSRLWIKALGFMTGMILCIFGSVFILGRFSEAVDLRGSGKEFGLSLATASQGIVMSLLGAILVVASILTNPPITTRDSPAYLRWVIPAVANAAPTSGFVPAEPDLPAPTPLPSEKPPVRGEN